MTQEEIKIWNRALISSEAEQAVLREGDRALAALLKCDALVGNGGVYHAVEECLDPEQVKAACEGYRYFGLVEAAEMLQEAKKTPCTEEKEKLTNDYYFNYVMKAVKPRFSAHHKENPGLYAPV